MSPERQQSVIEEICGWTNVREDGGGAIRIGTREIRISDDKILVERDHCIPDYLNDLNVMQEAVMSLPFSKRRVFREKLREVMGKGLTEMCVIAWEECIHATAAQRAEAFIRVHGKWEESV